MNQNQKSQYDYLYKIAMIGDSGVGKTNIISRYVMDVFKFDSKPTIGVEFSSKRVKREDKIIKVQVWDTAGQERYRAITSSYYRGAVGAFIVFDVTSRESFDNLELWIRELLQQTGESIPVFIIANKVDLRHKRVVSTEEAQAFAMQNDFGYVEVSALDSFHVCEAFDSLIDIVYEKKKNNQADQKEPIQNNENPTTQIIQGVIIPSGATILNKNYSGIAAGSTAAALMASSASSDIICLSKPYHAASSRRCKC